MSKSGPWEPLSRAASVEARLLIFGNRILLPVPRQHICPIRKSLPPGRKAVCISEAGYMADGFCCQHPKMTKPTKNETPVRPSKKPCGSGLFHPPRPAPQMWEVEEILQGTAGDFRSPRSEMCRNCVRPR